MSIDQHLSFAIGTIVKFKQPVSNFEEGEQVISEVSLDGADPTYAINGSAWFAHSELEFVAYPTKESLARAADAGGEDEDEGGDDEDEGGDNEEDEEDE